MLKKRGRERARVFTMEESTSELAQKRKTKIKIEKKKENGYSTNIIITNGEDRSSSTVFFCSFLLSRKELRRYLMQHRYFEISSQVEPTYDILERLVNIPVGAKKKKGGISKRNRNHTPIHMYLLSQ